jgi:predicted transcriptional regulator of viral defense system
MELTSEKALSLIQSQDSHIRTAQALQAGIHPRTLYQLRDQGYLEQISRGVYRLATHPPIDNPDLFIIATRIPQGVLCLVSALAFHNLTTQIPRSISIALPKGTESPRLDYPPISFHRFSPDSFSAGIEIHDVDGIPLQIYSPEKTLADCCKFRNKIGMDVFLEALQLYRTRKQTNFAQILHYGQICRVQKVITPYLEAVL